MDFLTSVENHSPKRTTLLPYLQSIIMTQKDKLIGRILSGTSDKNIDFNDLKRLLDYFNPIPKGRLLFT